MRTTTDDWPFLYIRPGIFPWGYLGVLAAVLALAFLSARRVFGARAVGAEFDPLLFMVGAGFLLIETRGVTTLSLLFGSTWMVNAAVFAGILLVALLANLYVERFGAPPLELCFGFLLLSVVLLWAIDNAALNRFGLPVRGVLGGLVNALPVGFAGVIVSTLLARSSEPDGLPGLQPPGIRGGRVPRISLDAGGIARAGPARARDLPRGLPDLPPPPLAGAGQGIRRARRRRVAAARREGGFRGGREAPTAVVP